MGVWGIHAKHPEGAADKPPPQMPLQSIPREGLQAGPDNAQENASAAPAKGSRWDSIPRVSGTNRYHQKPAGIQRGGDIKGRDITRWGTKEDRGYKESHPAGGKKGWQKKVGRRERGFWGIKKLPITKSYRELSVAGTGFEPATSGVCISF